MGMEEEEKEKEKPKQRSRREFEEDHTPLWIKIFGGTILSITFLCVITLTSYIVTNINSIQSQLNNVNAEMTTKKEITESQKNIWDSIKIDGDNIVGLKERLNVIESLAKDRQVWMEKQEVKISEQNKTIEMESKEIAAHKERANNADSQLMQLREENRQLQKDIQALRERVAGIEGKNGTSLSEK